MSQFFQAGLPAPKTYLARTRLLCVAAFLEAPALAIADVSSRLGYSTPQSFTRLVRGLLGMSGGAFRREVSLASAMSGYIDQLITPYRQPLLAFDPLGHGPAVRTKGRQSSEMHG